MLTRSRARARAVLLYKAVRFENALRYAPAHSSGPLWRTFVGPQTGTALPDPDTSVDVCIASKIEAYLQIVHDQLAGAATGLFPDAQLIYASRAMAEFNAALERYGAWRAALVLGAGPVEMPDFASNDAPTGE